MNNPTPGQGVPKGSIGLGEEFVQGPPSHQEGAPRHRAEQDRTQTLKFFGSGRTLFGMWIVNVLLTLVTLGVYYFWAKVKVRSYLLSQTEFEGDRFAYHGTGNELLVGGLRAVILFGVPFLILSYGPGLVGAGGVTLGVSSLLASFIILAVPAFATVWALRYRLGRTSWRGIRFSFRGRVRDYVTLFVKGILLTTITIGLYYPFYAAQKRAFMVSHSYFGNERFEFDGRGNELFKVYFQAFLFIALVALFVVFVSLLTPFLTPFAMLLLPFVPILAWLFTLAEQRRFFWDHTCFRRCRFQSTVTVNNLLLLKLGNYALLLFSLGLAWPWVRIRTMDYDLKHLRLNGLLDLAAIQQEASDASAAGDEVAGFVDVGFDLG